MPACSLAKAKSSGIRTTTSPASIPSQRQSSAPPATPSRPEDAGIEGKGRIHSRLHFARCQAHLAGQRPVGIRGSDFAQAVTEATVRQPLVRRQLEPDRPLWKKPKTGLFSRAATTTDRRQAWRTTRPMAIRSCTRDVIGQRQAVGAPRRHVKLLQFARQRMDRSCRACAPARARRLPSRDVPAPSMASRHGSSSRWCGAIRAARTGRPAQRSGRWAVSSRPAPRPDWAADGTATAPHGRARTDRTALCPSGSGSRGQALADLLALEGEVDRRKHVFP